MRRYERVMLLPRENISDGVRTCYFVLVQAHLML